MYARHEYPGEKTSPTPFFSHMWRPDFSHMSKNNAIFARFFLSLARVLFPHMPHPSVFTHMSHTPFFLYATFFLVFIVQEGAKMRDELFKYRRGEGSNLDRLEQTDRAPEEPTRRRR